MQSIKRYFRKIPLSLAVNKEMCILMQMIKKKQPIQGKLKKEGINSNTSALHDNCGGNNSKGTQAALPLNAKWHYMLHTKFQGQMLVFPEGIILSDYKLLPLT